MTTEGTLPEVLSGTARWCVLCGDSTKLLHEVPDRSVDAVVADPPYSAHTHGNMRGNRGHLASVGYSPIVTRDCGFDYLKPHERRALAREYCRIATQWIAVFTDRESATWWRLSLEAAGGSYRRTVPWIRWSSPQFNGQSPPTGAEDIVFAKPISRAGHWHNGGRTHYETKCLRSTNKTAGHGTEKPWPLFADIITDCTGDATNLVILDSHCGGGASGEAALRLGHRYIGIDINPHWTETTRDRLRACETCSTLRAHRAGQISMFGG